MTTSARRTSPLAFLVGAALLAAGACAGQGASGAGASSAAARLPTLDSARLVGDVYRLAHDSMAGRASGTPENAKARQWLVGEFRRIGLTQYEQPFAFLRRGATDSTRGVNVLGMVPGTRPGSRVIVVSAHYDHVGTRNGEIFNGADDNASGTAAILAMAAWFKAHPPENTLLFALWDAEEMGLQGARHFVAHPSVPIASIAANVNLDMVSRNTRGELYAAGATPYPALRPLLESVASRALVMLRLGHDSGGGQDDWTNQSDQGAFHAAGIPFAYFGVEDHPDYHKPTDDPERIEPGFYYRAVRTIAAFVTVLDVAVGSWPAR